MTDSVLDIAKLRLEALESEADELRNFIRMYVRLDGANSMPAPRRLGGGLPSAVAQRVRPYSTPSYVSSGGMPSPKEAIIEVARSVLKQVHPRPLLIGDLFEAVISRGVDIGGQNPKGNLSAKLAPVDDIVYIKDEGWYYRPPKDEPSDQKLSGEKSEGSLFATQAKGRVAVPGGGP